MSDRLALVTGGAGFIGRHVVRRLLDRDMRVRVLDVAPDPGDLGAGVEYVQGSVLDRPVATRATRGVDMLFHLAGNANLWARDKTAFHRLNVHGTRTVLEAAARSDVKRIVVTSSETVFFTGVDSANPIREDAPRAPAEEMPGAYCRSKREAESVAREAASRGMPVILVYPTLPVGPGDVSMTPPTRMIADFVRGRTPAYLNCLLNLIAVEDVAEGHILAAERGKLGAGYILGNENLFLSEVLERIGRIAGVPMPRARVPYWMALVVGACSEFLSDHVTRRPPVAPLAGVRLAGRNMPFDSRKAVEELGLALSPIEDALARQIAWLRSEKMASTVGDAVSADPSARRGDFLARKTG